MWYVLPPVYCWVGLVKTVGKSTDYIGVRAFRVYNADFRRRTSDRDD